MCRKVYFCPKFPITKSPQIFEFLSINGRKNSTLQCSKCRFGQIFEIQVLSKRNFGTKIGLSTKVCNIFKVSVYSFISGSVERFLSRKTRERTVIRKSKNLKKSFINKMSFFLQLKLLLWKNYILRKRHWVRILKNSL